MSLTRTRPALSAVTFTASMRALVAAPRHTVALPGALLTVALAGTLLTVALTGTTTPAQAATSVAAHTASAGALTAPQSAVGQLTRRAAPQPPGPHVFIEVSPSTVEPGHLVGLRASCPDNSVGAIAVSDAFGRVAVQPQRGLLNGTAQVKDRVLPGSYRVKLECRGGESASTMLQVVRTVKPSRGPATGFGGAAETTSNLLLPGGLALTVSGMILWGMATRRRHTGR